jgi:hypothetical protein
MWELFVSIAFAATPAPKCYSLADMKSYVCWALCRQEEYESGYYSGKDDDCNCVHKVKFKEMADMKIHINFAPQQTEEKQKFYYRPYSSEE